MATGPGDAGLGTLSVADALLPALVSWLPSQRWFSIV